jgi:hypothetical protein
LNLALCRGLPPKLAGTIPDRWFPFRSLNRITFCIKKERTKVNPKMNSINN